MTTGIKLERIDRDTNPLVFEIIENGSRVNLTGWDVYFNYLDTVDGMEMRITGKVDHLKKGNVKFYPRFNSTQNITDFNNPVNTEGLRNEGSFDFEVIREKIFYYTSDEGIFVIENENTIGEESYVFYNSGDPEHDNLQRFDEFTERITSHTGSIKIAPSLFQEQIQFQNQNEAT